jgi:hypothetical protein
MSKTDQQKSNGDETPSTEPVGERFIIGGESCALRIYPLVSYYTMSGLSWPFADWPWMTGRSYLGTWEELDQRLYLVALLGQLKAGDPATLASLFPQYTDRVFAHWYSGVLEIPSTEGPGMGDTTRERPGPRRLTFRRGVIVRDEEWRGGAVPELAAMTGAPSRWRSLIDRCLGRDEVRS